MSVSIEKDIGICFLTVKYMPYKYRSFATFGLSKLEFVDMVIDSEYREYKLLMERATTRNQVTIEQYKV